jgi:hypothetical protein
MPDFLMLHDKCSRGLARTVQIISKVQDDPIGTDSKQLTAFSNEPIITIVFPFPQQMLR